MPRPCKSAFEICEYALEVTREALLSGDFELFSSCFAYPLELQTFIGQRVIRDYDELRNVFNSVRQHYANNGVTDIVRHCVESAFKDDKTVEAVHETRLLSGTLITQAPFPVFSRTVYDGVSWRVVHTSYAIPDRPEHDVAILGPQFIDKSQVEKT